jgi:hypothetical protein
MTNDQTKYANEARVRSAVAREHSAQARESSNHHASDVRKMQRVGRNAIDLLKQGQESQRKREARKK